MSEDEAKVNLDATEADSNLRNVGKLLGGMGFRTAANCIVHAIAVIERQAAENARLKAELGNVCSRHNLCRCKGCGDYVTDLADEEKVYCWGCQDDIDDNGEIDPEYREEGR